MSKDERKALKELQLDTSVAVLQADKSRSTVILNGEDYLEKCMDLKAMVYINYLKRSYCQN